MIQGSAKVNISSCKTIKPITGFDPTTHLNLVRNPNYVQSTDNDGTRANYLNGVEITVDPNVADIFAKVAGPARRLRTTTRHRRRPRST